AERGFTATREVLDGERGLWIMASSDRCDFARMVQGLGADYETLRVSLKPYPWCRWIHSTLDAVRELMVRHAVRPGDVRRVTVRLVAGVGQWSQTGRPATRADAEFSFPHAGAMAIRARPRAEWWPPATRTDPAVVALMDRVVVETDPAAQAEYATSRNSAR